MATHQPGPLGANQRAGESPLSASNSENEHLLRLTRSEIRLILRTSEGFGAQFRPAQAKVVGGSGNRRVRTSGTGHPVSQHVRGNKTNSGKSKFRSVEDMADALMLAFQTVEGRSKLLALRPGIRSKLEVDLIKLFPIELHDGTDSGQWKTYGLVELEEAGISATTIRVIIEGRRRSDRTHLHIVTCFPVISSVERARLT